MLISGTLPGRGLRKVQFKTVFKHSGKPTTCSTMSPRSFPSVAVLTLMTTPSRKTILRMVFSKGVSLTVLSVIIQPYPACGSASTETVFSFEAVPGKW